MSKLLTQDTLNRLESQALAITSCLLMPLPELKANPDPDFGKKLLDFLDSFKASLQIIENAIKSNLHKAELNRSARIEIKDNEPTI